jgi:hypothetical protein
MGKFWEKLEEARRKGISGEEFEKLENLEAAIAYHQNEIEDCEQAIKNIESMAMNRARADLRVKSCI